jgi:predicted  nucleic acid-binding Zn-ribbon protein
VQSISSAVLAVTAVTVAFQNSSQKSSQDSRKVQSDVTDLQEYQQQTDAAILKHQQQITALEKNFRQLKQAKAAPSGWFSG